MRVPKVIVTGIHVSSVRLDFADGIHEAALGGEYDGMRIHVWFRFPASAPESSITVGKALYVNPLTATKPSEPGYFETRTWRADSARCRALIDAMVEVLRRDSLASKAVVALREKEEAERVFRLQCHKQHAMLEVIDQNLDVVLAAIANADPGLSAKIRAAADGVTS